MQGYGNYSKITQFLLYYWIQRQESRIFRLQSSSTLALAMPKGSSYSTNDDAQRVQLPANQILAEDRDDPNTQAPLVAAQVDEPISDRESYKIRVINRRRGDIQYRMGKRKKRIHEMDRNWDSRGEERRHQMHMSNHL